MQSTSFSKHVAPGHYRIKEAGGVIKASVDRLLADGSMLSAPENEHLLETIDAIIMTEYPAAPTSLGQQGTSVTGLASDFGILVQWMKVRGIHYFGHLTEVDLLNYLYDSSCGLDAVLKSQELLSAALQRHQSNGTKPAALRQALVEAGIPHSQAAWLPAASALFDKFTESGRLPPFRELPPKRVTTGVLWKRAKSFQHLWLYRDQVTDCLSFEPSLGDIAKHVKRWGKPIMGTRTLPVDYTCNLVGLAFTWLYEYGPLLADVQRVLAYQPENRTEREAQLEKTLSEFNLASASRGWPIRLQTIRDKPGPDHYSWFVATSSYLPIACFVLCGIFTARRMAELVSIFYKRLQGDEKTGYWFTSYVGKRAKYEAFPCSVSVADSIRALAHLMELRGIDKDEPVFSAIRGTGRLSQRLRNGLARFGRLVKSEDGKDWQLAAHQFRKVFALIYRWRYDHPSLIALSVYFGHVNPKHIRPYINSKEWKRDHLEAGKQFTLEKLRDIALGNVQPKGTFGKKLERAVARELSKVELADESEQLTVLSQLVEHRQLDLKATLWGYCGVRSVHSNIRRAACATEGDIRSKATIDPEKSSEDKCAGCLFFCTDQSRRAHWMRKSKSLQSAVDSAPGSTIAKRVMQQRLHKIESFTRNNFAEPDANENAF